MKVQEVKKMFRPGTRIRLLRMDDTQAPPRGTEGEVIGVDDIGSVLMEWSNGSGLNLIPGTDRYEIIERVCPVCGSRYKEHPALSRRDNGTEICSRCGMREALTDCGMTEQQMDEVLRNLIAK